MNRDGVLWSFVLAAVVFMALQPAHAGDGGSFYASLGGNYTSGKYGQATSTTIWDVPFSAGYSGNRWSFRVTVPYLYVSGPANVIPGIGAIRNNNPIGRGLGHLLGGGTTGSTTTSGTASGLGDVTAQATLHALKSRSEQFELDVTGKVEFGTASASKGLGTGQNNYVGEVNVYKGLGSSWTAFGGVGYSVLGSSTYIQLKNVWSANVGVNYAMDRADSAGIFLYYQQRPSVYGYSRQEATFYYNHKVDRSWSLQGYMLGGFANGSPDFGLGASAKYAF